MTEPEAATTDPVASFDGFFEMHHERLLRAMYLATGDRHEAEDLAQEAMVRVYERWDRVGGMDDPVGYLYRTALNLRRSRLRRLVAGRSEEARDPAVAATEGDTVRRALAALPDGQREAVVLVEWLGLTDAQAGEVLRISPGAVRVRLTRARSALRERLRGESDG